MSKRESFFYVENFKSLYTCIVRVFRVLFSFAAWVFLLWVKKTEIKLSFLRDLNEESRKNKKKKPFFNWWKRKENVSKICNFYSFFSLNIKNLRFQFLTNVRQQTAEAQREQAKRFALQKTLLMKFSSKFSTVFNWKITQPQSFEFGERSAKSAKNDRTWWKTLSLMQFEFCYLHMLRNTLM